MSEREMSRGTHRLAGDGSRGRPSLNKRGESALTGAAAHFVLNSYTVQSIGSERA